MRRRLMAGLLMWLASLACADGDRDLPRSYRRIEIPSDLSSAESRSRGEELFHAHCALCHGERGDGQGVRREGLSSPPRDFTDPQWRIATSPRHVFFAIREGVRGTPMPSWKALSEQDAWAMTAYVWSLAGAPEGVPSEGQQRR